MNEIQKPTEEQLKKEDEILEIYKTNCSIYIENFEDNFRRLIDRWIHHYFQKYSKKDSIKEFREIFKSEIREYIELLKEDIYNKTNEVSIEEEIKINQEWISRLWEISLKYEELLNDDILKTKERNNCKGIVNKVKEKLHKLIN